MILQLNIEKGIGNDNAENAVMGAELISSEPTKRHWRSTQNTDAADTVPVYEMFLESSCQPTEEESILSNKAVR